MRLSSQIKTTLGLTLVLSSIAAVAWAQNLEVKGNAWFATGGTGSAGIGTSTPLGKLHVKAPGGFTATENADGTSPVTNVPIVAQGTSTVYGILNGSGRQAGAINIDGDGGTTTSRGYVDFNDKADGAWHQSIVLNKGLVGIGITAPLYPLDVNGDIEANGWLRTKGNDGWFNQTWGGGWFMQDATYVRAYAGKSVWVDGAIVAAGQQLSFNNTAHAWSGWSDSATGRATIENASDYNTLMIVGRSGTPVGRKVSVWDYLEVNGRLRTTGGTVVYTADCGGAAGTGAMTLQPTCTVCTNGWSCGGSGSDCCGFTTYNNPIAGKLVDP
ncbi:MAG TPA: shufflon system plasmid conjugative transfer pilus tip adhesin PilV [Myxococcales bacterium]|jgi:hypothetical protein